MFLKKVFLPLSLLLSLSTSAAFSATAKNDVLAGALKEGNLYIYGAVVQKTADSLVKEFQSLYPGIRVDFINMTGSEVFSRHMGDLGARRVSADILWSREIPLQAALVKDGYYLKYRPTEAGNVIGWANMGDTSFVTGFEPVVMVYNKKAFSRGEYPASHKAMENDFREEQYRDKIGTCDPEKNDLAFLLLTQDMAFAFSFKGLQKSFGDARIKLFTDYSSLLSSISSGEIIFGYNIPLSEVLKQAGAGETIGWFYPSDYTLALTQITMITKGATNPNAARLWTDFMFSKKAQQTISEHGNLIPIREDIEGGDLRKIAKTLPGGQVLKPVGTGAEVSRYNDKGLKSGFLLRWKQLLKLVK